MLAASPRNRGIRAGLTVGRGINLTLALIFLVLAILALVVVGNLATLQNKVSCLPLSVMVLEVIISLQVADHPDTFNTSHACILFSSVKDGKFKYSDSYMCESVIWGFAVMAGIYVSFLVVCIARVVVAAEYVMS